MFFNTGKAATTTVETVGMTQAEVSARNWLKKMIARGQTEMFSVVFDVTPELAAIMLEANIDNRPLRKSRIQRFAKIMKEKRWVLIAQGISFNRRGELNNGQHRLNAVVESGVAVRLNITFGEAPEAKIATDNGAPRNGADALWTAGHTQVVKLQSAARLIWNIERGSAKGGFAIENDELLRFVKKRPGITESVQAADTVYKDVRCSPAGLAAAHFLISKKHDPSTFFRILKEGVSSRTPIGKLRDKLMKDQPPKVEAAALIIKTWNADRACKPVRQLVWKRSVEPFPEVE